MTSTSTLPYPCVITPHKGTPPPRDRIQCPDHATFAPSDSDQAEALQVDKRITLLAAAKRKGTATGGVRYRPRSLTTAGIENRSSSKASTSTRNHRPTPGHPNSTRKRYFTYTLPSHIPAHSAAINFEELQRVIRVHN